MQEKLKLELSARFLTKSSGCCSTDLRNVLAVNVTDIHMSSLYCVLFYTGAFCVDVLYALCFHHSGNTVETTQQTGHMVTT